MTSLRIAFLRLGATVVGGRAIIYAMAQMAPSVPEPYKGVQIAAPPISASASASNSSGIPSVNTNTPPPGFPSTRRPPPMIEVGEGEVQPIDTKFGLSYTVPANWRNFSDGIAGWEGDKGSVTYGAIADYGRGFCPERETVTLAMSGMTGRNGTDIATAGRDAVHQADMIFKDEDSPDSVLTYSDPVSFSIDGQPALRYGVEISQLRKKVDCDAPAATFDIVSTTGYSNATVLVFMIMRLRGVDGALDDSVVDDIVATIRKTAGGER